MFILRKKSFWVMLILSLFILWLWEGCSYDRPVEFSERIRPEVWISDDALMVMKNGDLLTYDINKDSYSKSGRHPTSWRQRPPLTGLTPDDESVFFEVDDATFLKIDGEKVLVQPGFGDSSAGKGPLSNGKERFYFTTYRHLGEIGLIVFDGNKPLMKPLPLVDPANTDGPVLIWDNQKGQFLAFQTGCLVVARDDVCRRSAWWLDRDFNVLSGFRLPERNLLEVEEQLTCFSCGCGCFIGARYYVASGRLFYHVHGFPLLRKQRGLFEIVADEGDETKYKQLIHGRVEPDLAFSPSGCEVAYFKVSRFKEALKIQNLC